MKKILTFVLLIAGLATQAQTDKYVNAMKARLSAMDTTKTSIGWKNQADAFERIAEAEKTQWLPYYYSALCLVNIGWTDAKVDKDVNAAKVRALLEKAEAIEQNAELCTIRNMVATQQMLVDPQTRWATYGAESAGALQKGLQLDPDNPRIYYLQGAGIFNTPEQFGGGKEKAKPVLEKALALFNAAQPKPLYPQWGKKLTEDMLSQIK